MADTAYSSAANRAWLRKRGNTAVIPGQREPEEEPPRPGSKAADPPVFDPGRYKDRNTVERCFSKLKQ